MYKPLLSSNLFIISHLVRFVKHFFRFFQNLFLNFQNQYVIFGSAMRFSLSSLTDNYYILPHHSPFVNTFFLFFLPLLHFFSVHYILYLVFLFIHISSSFLPNENVLLICVTYPLFLLLNSLDFFPIFLMFVFRSRNRLSLVRNSVLKWDF